jgi:hypothetical protein
LGVMGVLKGEKFEIKSGFAFPVRSVKVNRQGAVTCGVERFEPWCKPGCTWEGSEFEAVEVAPPDRVC